MIIVTGAAGFIGANLVAALVARGEKDLVAADAFRSSGAGPDAPRRETRYLDAWPLRRRVDKEKLRAWLGRYGKTTRAVFHLGACTDTTVQDVEWVLRNNLEYSRVLWQWCTRARVPFIYASSAATYGDGSRGFDDEADPSHLKPLNLYGKSKHLFDLWALEQGETPPRWAGLKYFNVYGPREEHKGRMASVAFHAYRQIRERGEARLFESCRPDVPHGGQRRDFVFVEDAVAATLHFLDAPALGQAPNGLYNVGTGTARTFEDLAKAVFAALSLPPKIAYIPMPEDLRERYQHFTQATTAKLCRAGFTQPFHSLEDGVRKYVGYLGALGAASS